MTEQLKAEAYVRSQRPDLIERGLGAKNFVLRDGTKVPILNNINLQDWLAALDGKVRFDVNFTGTLSVYDGKDNEINFNLTTGQPQTEADYLAFNDITSV